MTKIFLKVLETILLILLALGALPVLAGAYLWKYSRDVMNGISEVWAKPGKQQEEIDWMVQNSRL